MKTTLQAISVFWELFQQQENAEILYTVNWAAELDTDAILTSTWSQESTSGTIANEANDSTTASARLSGDPGEYVFTNKVTTASGDVKERQIVLIVNSNNATSYSCSPTSFAGSAIAGCAIAGRY